MRDRFPPHPSPLPPGEREVKEHRLQTCATKSKENGKGREYGSKAAEKCLIVAEFLAGGDILAWKSIKEIAAGTGLTAAETYTMLCTLVKRGWAEKDESGFRQSGKGLSRYAVQAQEYLVGVMGRLGLR